MKRKIGILIFTDEVKKRQVTNDFYDAKRYWGLRCIVGELNQNDYEVEIISSKNIKYYDFVLCSLISAYDVFNFINEMRFADKGNAKIVVGGPGCNGIRLFSKFVDYAVFGRGEYVINDIFEGNASKHPHVWDRSKDPRLEGKYAVGILKKFIPMMGGEEEKAVGCRNKCFFCHYSWFNHFVVRSDKTWTNDGNIQYDNIDNYSSSFDAYEDFFQTFTWERRRGTTALDGVTEQTRYMINKPMSRDQVVDKLKEFWMAPVNEEGKKFRIKIYNIVGYPWEDEKIADLSELRECFREADLSCPTGHMHDIFILMHYSHFIPMPSTPLGREKFNFINFQKFMFNDGNKYLYQGKNFQVHKGLFTYSASHSFENAVIYRMWEEDLDFFCRVFLSNKYSGMKGWQKIQLLKSPMFEKWSRRYEIDEPMATDYLITPHNAKAGVRILRKRMEEYANGTIAKENLIYSGVWKRYEGPDSGIRRYVCKKGTGELILSEDQGNRLDFRGMHDDEGVIRQGAHMIDGGASPGTNEDEGAFDEPTGPGDNDM